MAEDKEIKCEVLKVVHETETRRGGKMRIQVVKWNKGAPTLEKREYWYDDEDNERPAKAKGFNQDDFHNLLVAQEEIDKLLTP